MDTAQIERLKLLKARVLADAKVSKPKNANNILQLKRKNGETLVAGVEKFNDKDFINIRVWFNGSDGELLPSRKGINITRNEAWDLMESLLNYFGVEPSSDTKGVQAP
jgi:hypothetical protein